jgi:hypothetical protein
MHALVAAVLLQLTWLDALDLDAEPQPPDGEFGEVEESIWASARHTIVGADSRRQVTLLKQAMEGGDGGFLASGVESFAEGGSPSGPGTSYYELRAREAVLPVETDWRRQMMPEMQPEALLQTV